MSRNIVAFSTQFAVSSFVHNLGRSSGQIVSCCVFFFSSTFVGSTTTPMCTLQASWSLILKIWNLVVPIHPSEIAASHSAFQQPCVLWSGIHACSRLTHTVDVFHWNSECVSLFGRTSWIDVLGDALNAVTTHCSRSIFRFPLRSLFLHVFLLTMKIEAKKEQERPTKSCQQLCRVSSAVDVSCTLGRRRARAKLGGMCLPQLVSSESDQSHCFGICVQHQ